MRIVDVGTNVYIIPTSYTGQALQTVLEQAAEARVRTPSRVPPPATVPHQPAWAWPPDEQQA